MIDPCRSCCKCYRALYCSCPSETAEHPNLGRTTVRMNARPPRLAGAGSSFARCRVVSARRWCPSTRCRATSTSDHFVRIYWDLDNIKPPAKCKGCREIVQALKDNMAAAASEGFGRQISPHNVELHGHCNDRTCKGLSEELKQALLTPSGPCLSIVSRARAEAADQAIIASMLLFAKEHGCNSCVGVISGDQGFAKTLQYCRSLGCYTVAVCKERPYSGKGRSNRWARQPMQAAVHCALSWDAIVDALSACYPPAVAQAPIDISDS